MCVCLCLCVLCVVCRGGGGEERTTMSALTMPYEHTILTWRKPRTKMPTTGAALREHQFEFYFGSKDVPKYDMETMQGELDAVCGV